MIRWAEIRRQLLRMDPTLLIALAALMVMGVLFIYSAGFQREDLMVKTLYRRQMFWILLGLGGYLATVMLDYHRLGEQVIPVYVFIVFLLVAVLLVGQGVHGARRWLNLGIKVQPAEFAKLGVIITLAVFLARPGRMLNDGRTVLGALAIMILPFLLIVQQPDLGTAMVLLPITLVMLFVAGVRLRILLLVALVGLMLLPVGWLFMDDYQKERIMVFLELEDDPLGKGWNKEQSEIAVASGGLSGKGFKQGTQNILGFLPRTVAPTDFIYSVIAEEMGFVGSSLVVALYAALLLSLTRAALHAKDKLGRLLVVGVMALVFSHVTVNVAMTVGLMPITGLPLPLLSYGGSITISTLVALGLVQSVYVRRYRNG